MIQARQLTLVSLLTGAFLLVTVIPVAAQMGRLQGEVMDTWGNGLEGAVVTAVHRSGGLPQEQSTDDKGKFQFIGLQGGTNTLEIHADGYQAIRMRVSIRANDSDMKPVDVELDVLPTGGRFRGDNSFEADGGTPKVKFDGDGKFEFQDANGEGEGTYGIVELSAVMVVRKYDGPDDSYSVNEPVVVTFASEQFTKMLWDNAVLAKK